MSLRPDVIVVGGGLAGLSVAWHLSRDHRVLVLEQGAQPGAEASAQNAGMVRRLGEDPHERALALRTHAFLEAPTGSLEGAMLSRVTGAVVGLATDPHHLHDGAAHLRAAGVRIEAVDRPGEVAPILEGTRLAAAWYLPDERVADAHALVDGLLRGIRAEGGEVRCGVPVSEIRRQGGRVVGVRTRQGDIDSEWTVLAAGAWSGRLAAPLGLWRPLFPLRRSLLFAAAHEASRPDHPWTWIDDEGVYARPETGGWLVSGCDERHDPPEPGAGSMGPVTPENRGLAIDKIERFFPALCGARLARGWTGLRTFAPDRAPILGPDPDAPGLAWATGLGGYGVTCSIGVGECVAAWMRGDDTPWVHRPGVAPNRPHLRRWPIRPLGDIHRVRLVSATPPPQV
ncbi:MAG: FAD-binding oxidoreductase [Myxococcota bacterium]|nr:FAD-binding oxidoreductase [Myxococcota bacterium]